MKLACAYHVSTAPHTPPAASRMVSEALRVSCRHAGVLMQTVVACWRRRWAPPWHTILRLGAGLTLVVAGCAILEAIMEIWPAKNLGVADRGIREGILRSLMARDGWRL